MNRSKLWIGDGQKKNELYHHGILGQKWGVRRYQNKDGTLTEAGKKRKAKSDAYIQERISSEQKSFSESRKSNKELYEKASDPNTGKQFMKDYVWYDVDESNLTNKDYEDLIDQWRKDYAFSEALAKNMKAYFVKPISSIDTASKSYEEVVALIDQYMADWGAASGDDYYKILNELKK